MEVLQTAELPFLVCFVCLGDSAKKIAVQQPASGGPLELIRERELTRSLGVELWTIATGRRAIESPPCLALSFRFEADGSADGTG
jgi:hypothetical protein